MEPKGSLPCSQKPAIEPYPVPAESNLSHRSLKLHYTYFIIKDDKLKCYNAILELFFLAFVEAKPAMMSS